MLVDDFQKNSILATSLVVSTLWKATMLYVEHLADTLLESDYPQGQEPTTLLARVPRQREPETFIVDNVS